MKNNAFILVCLMAGFGPGVMAGTVAGTGGATEVTQLAVQVKLGLQFAKQVQQYQKQLAADLKNFKGNGKSTMKGDVKALIRAVGTAMTAGKAIGGTMARIDAKFAAKYKSPPAASLSEKFADWHETSIDTLGGSMKAAGLHRDNYDSDTEALDALYTKSQATEGNLEAVQTLSQIGVMQVEQMQELGDLLATQNIAASAYMAEQTARNNEIDTTTANVMKFTITPVPQGSDYIGKK